MVNSFVLKSSEDKVHGYLNSLEDFINAVPSLDSDVLEFHVNDEKNDFKEWLRHEFGLYFIVDSSLTPSEKVNTLHSLVKGYVEKKNSEFNNNSNIGSRELEDKISSEPVETEETSFFNNIVNFLRKII